MSHVHGMSGRLMFQEEGLESEKGLRLRMEVRLFTVQVNQIENERQRKK